MEILQEEMDTYDNKNTVNNNRLLLTFGVVLSKQGHLAELAQYSFSASNFQWHSEIHLCCKKVL